MIMTEEIKREISEQDHRPEVDEALLADIVDVIRLAATETMGIPIRLVSTRPRIDPAVTARSFDTKFQGIAGFGIFMGLSTVPPHFIQ